MVNFTGAERLLDKVFIDGVMGIDQAAVATWRYLNSTLSGLSPEERAGIEQWTNLTRALERALRRLPGPDQYVLKLRFGLEDGMVHTQGRVGLSLGLAARRIGQIEERALRRLRHPAWNRGLVRAMG